MAENELWKNLLSQVQQTSQPAQQQPNPIVQPQPIATPQFANLPTLANLNPQPIIQPSAFVGIQPQNEQELFQQMDEDMEELTEQEDDFEDGIDTPVDNTFKIAGILTENPLLNSALITPTPEQINQNTVANIFNQTQPQQPVIVEQKRGRGRPPLNKAENVVASLPNISNQQELDKSSSTIEAQNAKANSSGNSIVANIPKEKIRELGESILRIGQTLIEISR